MFTGQLSRAEIWLTSSYDEKARRSPERQQQSWLSATQFKRSSFLGALS
jgi:hypothetical protein